VSWTRLSRYSFLRNEVRLWLSVLTYKHVESLAAASVAEEHWELVADEFTAALGRLDKSEGPIRKPGGLGLWTKASGRKELSMVFCA
jgi:hypothetical protein